MTITWLTYLIVCPLVFLGGVIDAIGGGGGLITLPAFVLAGIPVHNAIATNKISSFCGTSVAVARYYKNGLINLKLGLPTVAATLVGASIGAHLSMLTDEKIMNVLLFIILPLTAFVVFNKKLFHDNPETEELQIDLRMIAIGCLLAFVIGMYDGFYGPGTGTFLLIGFTVFAKLSIRRANGQAKLINLTSNFSSLVVFLLNGQAVVTLGLAAAVCNMAGNYIGSGLALTKGSRITKPVILIVLTLLFLKILGVY